MRTFKRLVSIICTLALVVSLSATVTLAESAPKFTGIGSTTIVSTKIPSGDIADALKGKAENSDKGGNTEEFATTESTNDPYEPNDDIASATTMPSDTIYATIGYEGDADFFKKYFNTTMLIYQRPYLAFPMK